MTASIETSLGDLGRQRPEWEPWLAVVQEVLSETTNPKWDGFVPGPPEVPESKVPLLSGAVLSLDTGSIHRWTDLLFRTACRSGTDKMATLDATLQAASNDILDLFKASLCQDIERLADIAAAAGADAEAFQAVAALVPVPFLCACNRRWAASIAKDWSEGYCPVCGAWPAFAEVRGIDRSRYLRCGRCASEWQVHCLICAFCGMTDHKELVSLVPEKGGTTRVIEACKRCLGYVKAFTTLQATPAARVILDDLSTVDLDVAALESGYRRPQGGGYTLAVKLVDTSRINNAFFIREG